jgi:hypothetical protein
MLNAQTRSRLGLAAPQLGHDGLAQAHEHDRTPAVALQLVQRCRNRDVGPMVATHAVDGNGYVHRGRPPLLRLRLSLVAL